MERKHLHDMNEAKLELNLYNNYVENVNTQTCIDKLLFSQDFQSREGPLTADNSLSHSLVFLGCFCFYLSDSLSLLSNLPLTPCTQY